MKYLIILMVSLSAFGSDQILKRAAMHVIARNEGVRFKPYRDTNGHLTIGVGHLIKQGETFGRIDAKTVSELFLVDIDEHIDRCRRSLDDFDDYPVQVQVAILDGFYRGCLSQSPKTLRLLRQGLFIAASVEYVSNREYDASKAAQTGVYKRMDRNAFVFLRYGEKLESLR